MFFSSGFDFLGRMHPLWVHLPIGFVLFNLLVSFLFRKKTSKSVSFFLKISWGVTFVSTLITAALGWLRSQSGYYFPSALDTHALWGWLLVVLTFLAWLLQWDAFSHWKKAKYFAYAASGLLLFLAGHLGGELTHGEDYLLPKITVPRTTKAAENKIEPFKERSQDSIGVLVDVIQPILDQKCVACHNQDISSGGLNMQAGSFLKKAQNNKIVVPSKPYESSLFKRVVLPQDHTKFMPPAGTPLTYDEIALLEWWILEGAPPTASLGSLQKGEKIKAILSRTYGLDMKKKAWYEKATQPPLSLQQQQLLEQNNFNWRYLAAQNNLIDVRFLGGTINPQQLAALASVSKHITWLNLSQSAIADRDLEVLAQFENLTRLNLSKNEITEKGLATLQSLIHLEQLNLYETAVSDIVFSLLDDFPALSFVTLHQTQLSPTAIATFKAAHPQIEVVSP